MVTVKKGSLDDCNHVTVDGQETYLRIAGLGDGAFAFHHSTDGTFWHHLLRYFLLDGRAKPRVGFSSQSPTGKSCKVIFSEITYTPTKLGDMRGGDQRPRS